VDGAVGARREPQDLVVVRRARRRVLAAREALLVQVRLDAVEDGLAGGRFLWAA
jgi:hypothetical protein